MPKHFPNSNNVLAKFFILVSILIFLFMVALGYCAIILADLSLCLEVSIGLIRRFRPLLTHEPLSKLVIVDIFFLLATITLNIYLWKKLLPLIKPLVKPMTKLLIDIFQVEIIPYIVQYFLRLLLKLRLHPRSGWETSTIMRVMDMVLNNKLDQESFCLHPNIKKAFKGMIYSKVSSTNTKRSSTVLFDIKPKQPIGSGVIHGRIFRECHPVEDYYEISLDMEDCGSLLLPSDINRVYLLNARDCAQSSSRNIRRFEEYQFSSEEKIEYNFDLTDDGTSVEKITRLLIKKTFARKDLLEVRGLLDKNKDTIEQDKFEENLLHVRNIHYSEKNKIITLMDVWFFAGWNEKEFWTENALHNIFDPAQVLMASFGDNSRKVHLNGYDQLDQHPTKIEIGETYRLSLTGKEVSDIRLEIFSQTASTFLRLEDIEELYAIKFKIIQRGSSFGFNTTDAYFECNVIRNGFKSKIKLTTNKNARVKDVVISTDLS